MPKLESFELSDTICVDCGNACNGGCSWSASLTPVDGWEAVETPRGYKVVACPLFHSDVYVGEDGKQHTDRSYREHMDNDGMIEMWSAVLRQMRRDYILGIGPVEQKPGMTRGEVRAKNRKVIENDVKRPEFCGLYHIENADDVVRQLRRDLAKAIKENNGVVI